MGYVVDTHSSLFIPATSFAFSAGTWTPTVASNVVSNVRFTAPEISDTVYSGTLDTAVRSFMRRLRWGFRPGALSLDPAKGSPPLEPVH